MNDNNKEITIKRVLCHCGCAQTFIDDMEIPFDMFVCIKCNKALADYVVIEVYKELNEVRVISNGKVGQP